MDCKDVQSKFIPFIDDKLSVAELDEFLKHMNECENCREEYDIYYTMIMGMRYLEGDNSKVSVRIDSEQKLKSAEDYLIKYRILYVEKILLLIVLCLGAVILL